MFRLRDRVLDICRKYGDVQRYGKPVWESEEEVAVLWWLNQKHGVAYDILARFIGVSPMSLYRLFKRIENGYADITVEGRRERIFVSPDELVAKVEEMIKPKARKDVANILESSKIQEFVKTFRKKEIETEADPVKRAQKEHRLNTILEYISRIARYIKQNFPDLPSNPDLWSEDMIEVVLADMASKLGLSPGTIKHYKWALRRVYGTSWFQGRVGGSLALQRERGFRLVFLPYDVVVEILESPDFNEFEKVYLMLQITTGAREGYSASYPETSMWGLRWSRINWSRNLIEIYESKTRRKWVGKLNLFFSELPAILKRIWEREGRPSGRIWEVWGIETPSQFERRVIKMRNKIVERYGDRLREMFMYREGESVLVPHDLRRTHVAWLADANVSAECIAKADEFFLGVGWEDLNTLMAYYARFTERRKAIELAKVQLRFLGDVSDDVVKMSGMSKEELKRVVMTLM